MKNKLNRQELKYLISKIRGDLDNLYNEIDEYRESGEAIPLQVHREISFISDIHCKLMDQYFKTKDKGL